MCGVMAAVVEATTEGGDAKPGEHALTTEKCCRERSPYVIPNGSQTFCEFMWNVSFICSYFFLSNKESLKHYLFIYFVTGIKNMFICSRYKYIFVIYL